MALKSSMTQHNQTQHNQQARQMRSKPAAHLTAVAGLLTQTHCLLAASLYRSAYSMVRSIRGCMIFLSWLSSPPRPAASSVSWAVDCNSPAPMFSQWM